MIDGPSFGRWVNGYERLYMVFRDGRVVNRHAQEMAVKIDRYGYANVRLNRDGKQVWKKVHRLICEAWHGPPPSPLHHAAHRDGRKLNNSPENLVWATPGENERQKIAHGTTNLILTGRPGASNPNAKLTDDQVGQLLDAIAAGHSTRAVAAMFGINQSRVVRIKNGDSYGTAASPTPSPHHPPEGE